MSNKLSKFEITKLLKELEYLFYKLISGNDDLTGLTEEEYNKLLARACRIGSILVQNGLGYLVSNKQQKVSKEVLK